MRKGVAIVVGLLVTLSGALVVIEPAGESEARPAGNVTAYVPHAPIRIDSNADFDGAHGVSAGNGTASNPWIIENWDIDGAGYGACIYVGNTTDWFVVRGCSMHEASGVGSWPFHTDSGLILSNVQNGFVRDSEGELNEGCGIHLYSSNNNMFDNNTVSNNMWGTVFESSNDNIIRNNTVFSSYDYGIVLAGCFGNVIYHNDIINNVIQAMDDGANLWNSSYPIGGNYWSDYMGADDFSGPNQDVPGGDGIGDIPYTNIEGDVAQDNYPLNQPIRNNGPIPRHPIRIDSDSEFDLVHGVIRGSGTIADPWVIEGWDINGTGYGYCIYVGNTTEYFVVRDCYMHHASGVSSWPYYYDSGLLLFNAQNGTIANNTVSSNNNHGVYLDSSSNNRFENNTLTFNTNNGIYVTSSNNNTFVNNNASSSIHFHGISFNSCTGNLVDNCTLAANGRDGIYVYSSNDNAIINNTIISNSWYGLYLAWSDGNTIYGNNLTDNQIGVFSEVGQHNNISRNDISENGYGLVLRWEGNNTIHENNVTNNAKIVPGGNLYTSEEGLEVYQNDQNWGNYADFWDQLANGDDGNPLFTRAVNVSGADILYVRIVGDANCPDLDLGVFLDGKNAQPMDGIPQPDEGVIMDADANADEQVQIFAPENGTYLIRVFGFTVSTSPGHFNMTILVSSGFSKGIYLAQPCADNVISSNRVEFNVGDGISVWYANNTTIVDNTVSNHNCGITTWQSTNSTITNNTASSNYWYGIYLYDASNNTIANNTASNNEYGIVLSTSKDNTIYHNNFINNSNQAYVDTDTNFWDNGYPSGGNYWSDYTGTDLYSGPGQNLPGSDGIGDMPYMNIQGEAGAQDSYPLMAPWTAQPPQPTTSFAIPVVPGWNLISVPLEIQSLTLPAQLLDGDTLWDRVMWYDPANAEDHWKQFNAEWSWTMNDLSRVETSMGFWINVTDVGDGYLNLTGLVPISTQIQLRAGWNLVGYPTLATNMTVATAFWGTSADSVEVFDVSSPYRTKTVGPDYIMKPGEGYWVHVVADSVWTVNW